MKRRDDILVGLLVAVALVIGTFGTVWVVRGGFRRGYTLYSIFRWGENLKVGQPVRLAGVQVGYVGDVVLNDNGTLTVDMKIDNERKVPRNARAIVEPVGLFGDAQISLQATPDARSFTKGDTVPPGVSPASIAAITAKGDSVATTAVALSRQIQAQLVDSGGFRDLRQTLNRTNALVAQLSTIAAAQNVELARTQASVRQALSGVNPRKIDSTLSNAQAASASAAALADSLKLTTSRLNATLALVQNGQGTAGKLLTDSALYYDVHRLVGRLDSLTADFQKNPGRYTKGIVRIF